MDREKAIQVLKRCEAESHCEHYKRHYCCIGCGQREALDLAIEALQEPITIRKVVLEPTNPETLWEQGMRAFDGLEAELFVKEKHQLSGETSTNTPTNTSTNEGDAESATTTDCISRQQAIEAIEGVDWYHVNSKGELVHGSTSEDESWYRAEDIYKAIESLPPVTPTVSDDCISRDYMLKLQRELHGWMPNDKSHELWQKIKDAPSVTPTERTGEWAVAYLDHESVGVRPRTLYCSECNWLTSFPSAWCPNCGAKMGGDAE